MNDKALDLLCYAREQARMLAGMEEQVFTRINAYIEESDWKEVLPDCRIHVGDSMLMVGRWRTLQLQSKTYEPIILGSIRITQKHDETEWMLEFMPYVCRDASGRSMNSQVQTMPAGSARPLGLNAWLSKVLLHPHVAAEMLPLLAK